MIDQGLLIRELDKLLRADADMNRYHAVRAQQRVAKALGTNRKSIDGIGRPRMELTPEVYHYWGQRVGYQCWKDKQFLHEFERDNPEVRVKSGGTRFQVGYDRREGRGELTTKTQRAQSSGEEGRKFHKNYGVI